MKTILSSLLLTAVALLFSNCTGNAQPQKPSSAKATANRIEVLDFHTEHRCVTCLEIERMVRKILAEDYAAHTKSGLITFHLINADDKANLELVRKYTAYGTTLVIRSFKDGKETHVDLTNFAFLNFNKVPKFTATIKKELNAALQRVKS
ncbi:MAG: hypothetical protein IPH16_09730 [Haliscomenobacter sp.]|nr:hypothetical protein [Haliscomenobacter sp.]